LVLPTGPAQAVAVAYTEAWADPVPDHDVTSPAEAAALVHAAAQVIRFTGDPRATAARSRSGVEFDRLLGPFGLFERQGCWFRAVEVLSDYPRFFQAHLAGGFLLSPDPEGWGVVPSDLSPGEWQAWAALVRTYQGGA